MKLLLWDIDGTLLLTGGTGMGAMQHAGQQVLGPAFSFEGVVTSGGVDHQLYAEAAERSGLTDHAVHHERFRDCYVQQLERDLHANPHKLEVMPGVRELLPALVAHDGVVVGMVTGNYHRAAKVKLKLAQLDPSWFVVGAFSDHGPDRPSLVRHAIDDYHAQFGNGLQPHDVIVIGDTPRDVDCAKANGCRCLGVGTGRYTVDELRDAGADDAVEHLGDASALYAMIER